MKAPHANGGATPKGPPPANAWADQSAGAGSIEFGEYVRVLRQRRIWIATVTVVVIAIAAAYTFTRPETFAATAAVQVRPVNVDPSRINVRPDQLIVLTTEREVVRSHAVADIARRQLSWQPTTDELIQATQVSVPGTTQVLMIRFEAGLPQRAQQGAQAMAEAYLEHRSASADLEMESNRSRVLGLIADAEAQLAEVTGQATSSSAGSVEAALATTRREILLDRVSGLHSELADIESMSTIPGELIGPASTPTAPVGPVHSRTLALGALAGLILGIASGFVRDRLDDRMRDDADVLSHTTAPVLGHVPKSPRSVRSHVRSGADPTGSIGESYRKLRANTLRSMDMMGAKTLLITSPVRGDRKTTTAVNLAAASARTGRKVALVSADLRLPTIHRVMGLNPGPGLSEVLEGGAGLEDVVQRSRAVPSLDVITGGRPQPFLGDLLQSERLDEVIAQLAETYDLVVLDSPPVLPVADSLALSRPVDAVLLSVRASRTRLRSLEETVLQLRSAGALIIGSVVHDAASTFDDGDSLPYLMAIGNGKGNGRSTRTWTNHMTHR